MRTCRYTACPDGGCADTVYPDDERADDTRVGTLPVFCFQTRNDRRSAVGLASPGPSHREARRFVRAAPALLSCWANIHAKELV